MLRHLVALTLVILGCVACATAPAALDAPSGEDARAADDDDSADRQAFVAAQENDCDGGDAVACTRLGVALSVEAPPRSARALGRACELRDGAGCFYAGVHAEQTGEAERARAFHERGCRLGSGWACVYAAWFRNEGSNSGGDAFAAHDAMQRACQLGTLSACRYLKDDRTDRLQMRWSERGLGRDEVEATIWLAKPKVLACYRDTLSHEPTIEGAILVQLLIRSTGELGEVTVINKGVSSDRLAACVRRAFLTLRFLPPRTAIDVKVSYPYEFHIEDGLK